MARILITEDERTIAEDLMQTLMSFGQDIVGIAATAEEAIEAALKAKPDIIFMDVELAGKIDGVFAAREIQKRLAVPIIFCTAYSDDETLLRITAMHAAGCICKPFSNDDIKTAIRRIIN